MLSLNSVTKKFGSQTILDDITLNIEPGSVALFLGQSGVGKSTLLRVLCGLETADSGTISLNNKTLTAQSIIKSHAVGMVFQQFNLFTNLSVERNITLALEEVAGEQRSQAHAIARQLLDRYDLADKAKLSVNQLSGGQKQRLALARTLALKPKVVCLDEPTSALDPLLTTHIADTIAQLAKEGYIVAIASHDTQLIAKLSCTVYLMSKGRIIETASSHNLNEKPEQFKKIHTFIAGKK